MAQVIVVYVPEQYDKNWMSNVVLQIQQAVTDLSTPVAGGYTVTNGTTTRTLDPTTATAADVGQVLATLIDDLQTKGVVE